MLNLVVLRGKLELMRPFYEALGLTFTEEKHGAGPTHLACEMAHGVVLEIYPRKVIEDSTLNTILGLEVDVDLAAFVARYRELHGDESKLRMPKDGKAVLGDPEGHRVFVTQKPKPDREAEIERVARAISRARLIGDYGEDAYDQEGELDRAVDGTWFRCCSEAIAAIEATRNG